MVSNKFEEDALLLSLESVNAYWVLDFGALFHATPHRDYFIDYVEGDFGLFHLGDNEPYQIFGKGKIKIKLQNGNHWLLHEVRHVPKLSRNLISAGQLGDEGCVVTFNGKKMKSFKRFSCSSKRCESRHLISFYMSYCSFYFNCFRGK